VSAETGACCRCCWSLATLHVLLCLHELALCKDEQKPKHEVYSGKQAAAAAAVLS
jgi:hypothetical protein